MTDNEKNRQLALAAKEKAIKNGLLKHPVVYLKNCESKLVKEIQKEREATQRARLRAKNKWVKVADRPENQTNENLKS